MDRFDFLSDGSFLFVIVKSKTLLGVLTVRMVTTYVHYVRTNNTYVTTIVVCPSEESYVPYHTIPYELLRTNTLQYFLLRAAPFTPSPITHPIEKKLKNDEKAKKAKGKSQNKSQISLTASHQD